MTAKEKAKDIFKRIKAAFDAPIVPPAPPAPGGPTSCGYAVDGGSPVYVDISDDGLPDIDANDKVYTDSAMTTPYPDGTYKVTGTDFGFTVAGGVVTTVTDPDNLGPGTPIDDSMAKQPPAPPTPNPPAPPAPPQPVTMSAEEIRALCAKFALGSPEDRLANLETMVKALMENNFGYQIRQGQENEAIQTYKESLANTLATATSAMQAASQKIEDQSKQITKHEETIKGLFELCEKLVELPTGEPITLSGPKKEQFEKTAKREKYFEDIAASLKKIKTAK